jgi:hypothetical protein
MNDIRIYSIWTYEKQISHDYYYQVVTHEVCDVCSSNTCIGPQHSHNFINWNHYDPSIGEIDLPPFVNDFDPKMDLGLEGPTTLLGAARALLNHYFIFKILLEYFNTSFKKSFKSLKFF